MKSFSDYQIVRVLFAGQRIRIPNRDATIYVADRMSVPFNAKLVPTEARCLMAGKHLKKIWLCVSIALLGNRTIVASDEATSASTSIHESVATDLVPAGSPEGLSENLAQQFRDLMTGMSPAAKQGYRHLTESVYLPADFDQDVIDELASKTNRPHPLAGFPAAKTSQQSYLSLFGLSPRPDVGAVPGMRPQGVQPQSIPAQNSENIKPLQYVVHDGQYVMNCFACHGGDLYGASYPGSPNTTYLLSSLTDEVRLAKVRMGKTLTHMDVGSMAMPLGENVGTSNAVMFGVALMHYRDADLNVLPIKKPAPMRHHDMDAPAWWTFHRKSHIYIDGFAEKGHKGLMQFMLIRKNGPEKFKAWENEFRDIYAFLEELRPPKYPYAIDSQKRERGETLFTNNCASCHGTYGPNASERTYPEVRIPLQEIGTDPVRGQALTSAHRQKYADSWFADYGQQNTIVELDGYVAPPLDGIWASAPYFHNGSVPTLWHVMNPESRPKVWRRTTHAPDLERIGFQIEEFEKMPNGLSSYDRRLHFDTRRTGKSAAGHEFFGSLTEQDKLDLIEYLKTL